MHIDNEDQHDTPVSSHFSTGSATPDIVTPHTSRPRPPLSRGQRRSAHAHDEPMLRIRRHIPSPPTHTHAHTHRMYITGYGHSSSTTRPRDGSNTQVRTRISRGWDSTLGLPASEGHRVLVVTNSHNHSLSGFRPPRATIPRRTRPPIPSQHCRR